MLIGRIIIGLIIAPILVLAMVTSWVLSARMIYEFYQAIKDWNDE